MVMLPVIVFPMLMLMLMLVVMVVIIHDASRKWYNHD